ncbi:hypothetical protein ACC808_24405 [Rhizobium ruizarguesonis]|uniref:hypothetical protein n=1 Tax=Rhizobium ruizarguesonis TaxID=2081791 RepID=UPI0014454CA3|nr:hypothetical protein [Rhizobium ruizarguesonis]
MIRLTTPSRVFFAITAVAYFLQMVPVVSEILFFLAVMAWPILLLNLGFLSMIFESAFGESPRILLIFPVLWFGGNAAAATMSQIRLSDLRSEVERMNEGKTVSFDPASQTVVFDGEEAMSGVASRLVGSYDAPVAFARQTGGSKLLAFTMGGRDICQKAWDRRSGLWKKDISPSGYQENNKLVHGLCVIRYPAAPPPSRITVKSRAYQKSEGFLLPFELKEFTLTDASGKSVSVYAGTAQTLSWYPLPILGCSYIEKPHLKCYEYVFRLSADPVGGRASRESDLPVDVIARALGLEKAPASTRAAKLNADRTDLP